MAGKPNNRQKGFTLIELLVVIGILAVLAAVAIPAYQRFFGQGEKEANLSELSNIQNAMDAMMSHHQLLHVQAKGGKGTAFFHGLPIGIDANGGTLVAPVDTDNDGIKDDGDYEYLHGAFLRIGNGAGPPADRTPTKMCYTWNNIGFVTQKGEPKKNGNC